MAQVQHLHFDGMLLQNRFHLKIGISSELAFDMLFLALPARGSRGGRPVR